ncbi:enoyl-CoA hydratase [Halobacteriales archaeon QS_1_69_70]|nr:MAG: enoyl-CoA hydratase [Halobacteriales archaeon QS_1_69_70]
MADYETIEVTRTGAVARLAFDRPDAHNTLDRRMAEELVDAAHDLVSDDGVRCLAVTGNGPAFNTGADLTTLAGDGTDEARLRGFAGHLHEFVGSLLRAPKPVVTGVNGVAAGGGLGPALCGDVVLVAEGARLEFAYPRIGLSGDGGSTYLLPRLVGLRRAQELAVRDEPVSGREAVDVGLATERVPDDELDERLAAEAERLAAEAERLAAGPTRAYGATKRLLHRSFEQSLERHLGEEADAIAGLTNTEDYARGHAAFGDEEAPEFVGE